MSPSPKEEKAGAAAIDNALSEYFFAIKRDCPARTWWNADFENRAPIYRALSIRPTDIGAAYAITPFRLAKIENAWLVLAAHPTPHVFDPAPHWLDIETVIAWDPKTDAARILGDDTAQLAGHLTDESNVIYASPRAFFQAWAQRRAQFAVQRQIAQDRAWDVTPREHDDIPGALMIGDVHKIRWSAASLPQQIECVGGDAQAINRAILRAARLPRVSGRAA